MCWTHWQLSINNVSAEQLVGLLGFGRMSSTLPTYVRAPQWCTEDPVHGERKYVTSRRYQSVFCCLFFFFYVSEQKFRSRFKVSGPLQYYRCAIKWWLLDTGTRDVYPKGGVWEVMVGRAALISFPSSLSLMRYTDPISYSAFLTTRAQK